MSPYQQNVLDTTLAEINRTQGALEDAYVALKRNNLDLKKAKKELTSLTDIFEIEKLEIDILELELKINNTESVVQGAIRKFSYFTEQYKSLLKSIGKESISEEDYELEEEKYHIMTAMKQALTAARSRQGFIDEGNNIYLQDMGINGATAQALIFNYLHKEQELLKQGKEPTHKMTMEFLEDCYKKFKGCGEAYSKSRGFKLFNNKSLHIGDR